MVAKTLILGLGLFLGCSPQQTLVEGADLGKAPDLAPIPCISLEPKILHVAGLLAEPVNVSIPSNCTKPSDRCVKFSAIQNIEGLAIWTDWTGLTGFYTSDIASSLQTRIPLPDEIKSVLQKNVNVSFLQVDFDVSNPPYYATCNDPCPPPVPLNTRVTTVRFDPDDFSVVRFRNEPLKHATLRTSIPRDVVIETDYMLPFYPEPESGSVVRFSNILFTLAYTEN